MKANPMKTITMVAALIAVVIPWASCTKDTVEQQFETTIVKRRSLSSTVLATGVVKPKVGAEVRVGSRVSGIVKILNVNVGDAVERGDVLATIDDRELKAQYDQAAANLENAKTTLVYATIEIQRQEALLAQHDISQQSYDGSVREYDMARAQVALTTANLEYAKLQLDNTIIIAPISGAVASVSTQRGETVAAMFAAPTFLTIIDLTRLEVRAYVDETDISKVREGQRAEFTVDTYPGTTFQGTVRAVYPKAEILDNVVNYVAIIDMADRKGKTLRPEMTTTVNILTSSLDNVIAVPNKAITHKEGEEVVVVLKDGKAEERRIVLGVKGRTFTQIASGLEENETLILNK